MPRSLRRPSPALVVACLALAVALGGTSYADVLNVPRNSVGTANLKNNAVVSSKVKNRSLLAVDFRAGQLLAGTAGPKGDRGDKGDKGDKGDTGAAGLAEYEIVAQTTTATSVNKSVSVNCPAGKRALGGSASVDVTAFVALWRSTDHTNGTGWTASAFETQAYPGNWRITVRAICARVM